ncbi:MAG: hypothetical protein KIH08_01780 [Candidatus Freyarchaeota archaeon]|nr:hypothetical protein [Candidatus Jordarchaeia archaeon]MBS7268742.1 hypothetical protein [Candidatus Jordarchaeia archaeon]MBS7279435.1 hypothetical protein [Candidatus Jordarchaeia archaeon]
MSYDYYIADEVLKALGEEFSLEKTIREFASKIRESGGDPLKRGEQFFGEYGERAMKRAIELGDKYLDRQGEILKQVAQKTGHIFPHIPQRYLEIMIMGTRPTAKFYVYGNNTQTIDFALPKCPGYELLKQSLDQKTAEELPCRHACLSALSTLYKALKLPVEVEMVEKMPENPCHFTCLKK